MKLNIISLIATIMMSAFSISAVHADPVTLIISGKVIASPCTVSNGTNMDVDLGRSIQASTLTTAGSNSPVVDFNITFKDCPLGTSSVRIDFSGTADPDDATRYKNSGTGNVSVELIEKSTWNLKGNGQNMTRSVLADRSVTFDLRSRAYSKGNVTPGTINTVVLASVTYQ